MILPICPHHIVRRGHNWRAVFIEYGDYQYCLDNLVEWTAELGCEVYGYCLMTNHVHLIVDPGDSEDNLGLLIKRLAGRQTRLVNKVERRTGSLWEGRYKSSAIQTDRYLLAYCRYVDLNPVRAGMVAAPAEYRWSSFRQKTGLESRSWLDNDPCFERSDIRQSQQQAAYRAFVTQGIADRELSFIRQAVERCQLTGNNRFVDKV